MSDIAPSLPQEKIDSTQDKQKILEQFLEQQQEVIELQKQLIDAQSKIIQLQTEIKLLTPGLPEKNVNWHSVSGGLTSDEVLKSNNLTLIQSYQEWVFEFGEKYIKPYVHQRVFAEVLTHMLRGVSRRLAELEVAAELGIGDVVMDDKTYTIGEAKKAIPKTTSRKKTGSKKKSGKNNGSDTPHQPPLLSDDKP